jgi:hypothetical protein
MSCGTWLFTQSSAGRQSALRPGGLYGACYGKSGAPAQRPQPWQLAIAHRLSSFPSVPVELQDELGHAVVGQGPDRAQPRRTSYAPSGQRDRDGARHLQRGPVPTL